jgi:hypothetical protein
MWLVSLLLLLLVLLHCLFCFFGYRSLLVLAIEVVGVKAS